MITARWFYAQMLNMREKVPFSDRELGTQNGQAAQCQWMRTYTNHNLKDHTTIFEPPRAAASAGLVTSSRWIPWHYEAR